MGNANPHGARWSQEFSFHTDLTAPTDLKAQKPSSTRTSIQVPSDKELVAMKPADLPSLSNLEIRWRQWGVGATKLQGSPFSEIGFGFGIDDEDMLDRYTAKPDEKKENGEDKMEGDAMEAMEAMEGMEAPEGAISEQETETSAIFSKNITWQDRPFDFGDEEAVTLDTKLVHKIQYYAKRYRKGIIDCCEVRIAFLDSQGREITALESHDVPEDSVIHTYEKSIQFD